MSSSDSLELESDSYDSGIFEKPPPARKPTARKSCGGWAPKRKLLSITAPRKNLVAIKSARKSAPSNSLSMRPKNRRPVVTLAPPSTKCRLTPLEQAKELSNRGKVSSSDMTFRIRTNLGKKKRRDDDIEVMRNDKDNESRCKCPLTTNWMHDAVKNKTCGHVYSREGIMAHIQACRGQKTVCPFPGCDHTVLEQKNLEDDLGLQRLVKRMKRRMEAEEEQRLEVPPERGHPARERRFEASLPRIDSPQFQINPLQTRLRRGLFIAAAQAPTVTRQRGYLPTIAKKNLTPINANPKEDEASSGDDSVEVVQAPAKAHVEQSSRRGGNGNGNPKDDEGSPSSSVAPPAAVKSAPTSADVVAPKWEEIPKLLQVDLQKEDPSAVVAALLRLEDLLDDEAPGMEENRKEALDAGAAVLLPMAMRKWQTEEEVQKRGCACLWDLAGTSAGGLVITKSGGVEAIVTAIQSFPHSPPANAIGAIATLFSHVDNIPAIKEASRCFVQDLGGLQLVKKAMSSFPNYMELQKNGCSLLYNIADQREFKEAIIKSGAVTAVSSVLERHYDHEGIKECANDFMKVLFATIGED